jgi:hypothetical protein
LHVTRASSNLTEYTTLRLILPISSPFPRSRFGKRPLLGHFHLLGSLFDYHSPPCIPSADHKSRVLEGHWANVSASFDLRFFRRLNAQGEFRLVKEISTLSPRSPKGCSWLIREGRSLAVCHVSATKFDSAQGPAQSHLGNAGHVSVMTPARVPDKRRLRVHSIGCREREVTTPAATSLIGLHGFVVSRTG